eukprot:Unigene763_Nuclearia_a/m.2460 Unigene763_Nuclearia_a/g.2460  ORF Unigene763_Nuclearia_a/g.2460 Unigene763_Nuclearia_a/m.2460 type:complete len:238 (+) Unigene763_Nuclearia_a:131-844(+)
MDMEDGDADGSRSIVRQLATVHLAQRPADTALHPRDDLRVRRAAGAPPMMMMDGLRGVQARQYRQPAPETASEAELLARAERLRGLLARTAATLPDGGQRLCERIATVEDELGRRRAGQPAQVTAAEPTTTTRRATDPDAVSRSLALLSLRADRFVAVPPSERMQIVPDDMAAASLAEFRDARRRAQLQVELEHEQRLLARNAAADDASSGGDGNGDGDDDDRLEDDGPDDDDYDDR